MDSLRITLVIIGLLIIAGIYLRFRSEEDDFILWLKNKFSQNSASPDKETDVVDEDLIPVLTPIEDEPDMQDFAMLSAVISGREQINNEAQQQEIHFSAVDEAAETGSASLLIVLNIMSPAGHVFTGEGVHAVMQSQGLVHGEHDIYHFMQDGTAVFSVANAIEPGYFNPNELAQLTTPGLAIFMQLPGPMECRSAFDTLMKKARSLSDALGGELCDENRSALTRQTISHLQEKLDTYRLQQQAALRQKHS